jgi:hydrogenase maturation protease
VIDGGTVGPDLLPPVTGCESLLVLDAVDVGGEPGAVARVDLAGGAGRAGPRTIHELGLETLLQDLALLGEFPRRAVLFGIQPAALSPGTGLSPPVERGLETLVGAALDELRRWTQPAGGGAGAGNAGGNARTEDER